MTMVLSLLACAALFGLLGVVRPRTRCNDNCQGCTRACGSADGQEHHDG